AGRTPRRFMTAENLLHAEDLVRSFPVRGIARQGKRAEVRALNGVTLSIARGETLAVVGESGCGKSTLARTLVRLIELDSGRIHFAGEDVRALQGDSLRQYNRRVQLVFQDPYGSLNPRMTVGEALDEALRVHRIVPPSGRTARMPNYCLLCGCQPTQQDGFRMSSPAGSASESP